MIADILCSLFVCHRDKHESPALVRKMWLCPWHMTISCVAYREPRPSGLRPSLIRQGVCEEVSAAPRHFPDARDLRTTVGATESELPAPVDRLPHSSVRGSPTAIVRCSVGCRDAVIKLTPSGASETVPCSLRDDGHHPRLERERLRPVGGHDVQGRGAVDDLHDFVAVRVAFSDGFRRQICR
jgi:hypothetical protein